MGGPTAPMLEQMSRAVIPSAALARGFIFVEVAAAATGPLSLEHPKFEVCDVRRTGRPAASSDA